MPGEDYEPERVWDEYEWERFLRQQDERTDQYMELLEKYLEHPQRDQIIAREMDWTHLSGEESWSSEVDALLAADAEENAEEENERGSEFSVDAFEEHPLYRSSFALTIWIDQLFDEVAGLANEPAAIKVATHSALASAKLAAALSGEDADEIGMTIAYLKRSLKAITIAMDGSAQLRKQKLIDARQHSVLQQRLFQVRDGIIILMGEYRREWRRRFGSF